MACRCRQSYFLCSGENLSNRNLGTTCDGVRDEFQRTKVDIKSEAAAFDWMSAVIGRLGIKTRIAHGQIEIISQEPRR